MLNINQENEAMMEQYETMASNVILTALSLLLFLLLLLLLLLILLFVVVGVDTASCAMA